APASATAAESQSLRRTAEARVRLSSPTGAATHRSVRRAARSCESARPGSESGHLCAMRGFMTPPPGSRLAFRARHGHHFPRSHVLCALAAPSLASDQGCHEIECAEPVACSGVLDGAWCRVLTRFGLLNSANNGDVVVTVGETGWSV